MQPRRFTHYLKANKKTEMPSRILFVDTEANINKLENGRIEQTLRLGCAIYYRMYRDRCGDYRQLEPKEYIFKNIDSFYNILDDLIKEDSKLLVIAHNMAYDYTILKIDSYLSSRAYEIVLRSISSAFIVNASSGSKTISLISSTNYYRMSLEKLGEIFGFPKTKVDFENVDDKELEEYCKNDTRVLAKVIIEHLKFVEKNDLGNFKATVASQAFACFRHKFLPPGKSLLIHTFEPVIDLELESYRGGRCEAFKIGKLENVYKLDVNSMYPYVMKNNMFPVEPSPKKIFIEPSKEHLLKSLDYYFIIANCDLELNEPVIGCKRKKLIFPVGKIKQTITSPEIKYILENPKCGEIKKINSMVSYLQIPLFSKYVDYFYGIRTNAPNDAVKTMAKIFLNSIYGKFAQRGYPVEEKLKEGKQTRIISKSMDLLNTYVLDNYDLEDKKERKYIKLGESIYEIKPPLNRLSKDSMPVISSAVTSYARMYLWDLMTKAGLGNIYYCDTDSLFTNEIGYSRLIANGIIHDTKLGSLKLEETGNVNIFGVKNYVFNGESKLKGIKKDAVLVGENEYEQFQFLTKASKYRKGIDDGIVRLDPIRKKVSNNYDKGTVDNKGNIKPLIYNEW